MNVADIKLIAEEVEALGVVVVRKDKSKLFKYFVTPLVYVFTFGKVDFAARFWNALGNTVYAPSTVDMSRLYLHVQNRRSIRHELVHIRQQRAYTVPLWLFLYYLIPLPLGLAWFRFKFEREAYITQARVAPDLYSVSWIADTLGGATYIWAWPKPWIRKWFEKELAKDEATS